MQFIRNTWYFAGWSDELPPRGMLTRTIAGEALLMWANDEGATAAFRDVCPHRLVPLSLGRNEGDGVRCAYHGLKYSQAGCIENPHAPVNPAFRPQTYPLVRRHDVLWLWLGDPEKAEPNTIPDLSFIAESPRNAFFKNHLWIEANHQLLVDNILDLSHADFLHPATLGGGAISAAEVSQRQDGDVVIARWDMTGYPALPILRGIMPTPEAIADAFLEVRWYPSGVMTLENSGTAVDFPDYPGYQVITAHVMTPQDEVNTHYFYAAARNFLTDSAEFNEKMAAGLYQAFAEEDKPIAEAQQKVLGQKNLMDLKPRMLAIDKAATTARRIYGRLLQEEAA